MICLCLGILWEIARLHTSIVGTFLASERACGAQEGLPTLRTKRKRIHARTKHIYDAKKGQEALSSPKKDLQSITPVKHTRKSLEVKIESRERNVKPKPHLDSGDTIYEDVFIDLSSGSEREGNSGATQSRTIDLT